MSAPKSASVAYSCDADGVGWIVFDDPTGRANIFNPATQLALGAALDAAEAAPPRALVVISAKEKIFIAGADLKWLASLREVETAAALSRTGQRLFARLADSEIPVVCAIHGACAGGGFELALACHWRIASDAAVTQIGLPETSIGTIPGWGGSVRLPRLIGVKPALEHILRAQLVSANEALSAGMINQVVPAAGLKQQAKAAALKLVEEGAAPAPPPAAAVPGLFAELRARTQMKTHGHQPALLAAIDAVEQTSHLPLEAAFAIEARLFADVTVGEACKNLIHVFFLRDAAKKRTLEGWFEGGATRRGYERERVDVSQPPLAHARSYTPPIRRVGVIGAGVMGSGIAQWLAARGFEVVMRDVQPEAVTRGQEVIHGLFDESVRRKKLSVADAAAGAARVKTTTAWDGFAQCDVVIEAIVENAALKRALFTEVAAIVPPDTVLASNTSALPIEEIAGHVPNPERTVGIHFFNPVSRMPLVELIVGARTSAATAERALGLVRALGKSPVICRSSPGFLVTRVLFFYLNAAVRLWEEGASTAAVDGALREFGWPMGPLRLIDEVGIDVTDFIFGELAHYFPDRFPRTETCARLLASGLKGRKAGAGSGFYTYGEKEAVNESRTREIAGRPSELSGSPARERRDGTPRTIPALPRRATGSGLSSGEITAGLMRVMIDEAQLCLAEGVVKSPEDIDFALLSGAGFPAFRGGLMRYAATLKPKPPMSAIPAQPPAPGLT